MLPYRTISYSITRKRNYFNHTVLLWAMVRHSTVQVPLIGILCTTVPYNLYFDMIVEGECVKICGTGTGLLDLSPVFCTDLRTSWYVHDITYFFIEDFFHFFQFFFARIFID